MTAPGVNRRGVTPEFSEFGPGKGLMPNPKRGYVPDNFDELKAIQATDAANPDADHEAMYTSNPDQGSVDSLGVVTMGDLRPDVTPRVKSSDTIPTAGQWKVIDPGKPNGGDPEHFSDGVQDGSGDAWRAAQPFNPVKDGGPNVPQISGP